MFDELIVSQIVDVAGGVVVVTGVEYGHFSGEEVVIGFEVECGAFPATPDAKTGFVDDGGVLPADTEVEFAFHTVVTVEDGPSCTAAETGFFFVGPVCFGDVWCDGAVDDEAAFDGMFGNVEPAAAKVDTDGNGEGGFDVLYEGGGGDGLKGGGGFG